MDPASTSKQHDLNSLEPPSKYKHVFSTNELLLQTYYGIAGAFIMI